MGPIPRITENLVAKALPLPKKGAVIGGKKVKEVRVQSTDRDYYTVGITMEKGVKRKDVQAALSELLNCHVVNTNIGDLAVRTTHFEMIPTKNGPTVYVVMRIVPMVYNNPGKVKSKMTPAEDFEDHYGPKFSANNPKKWFRQFELRNPHGPAHRDKLWKFVGWVGESYGYCNKDSIYHRRASTIMPKIKITKAIDGADTFYHTHPSKDEPSLTSPDDYMLYFDLSYEPRNIRHFYTIMKDRIDYFKITPKKGSKGNYVRIDQDKFLEEVDAKIDEFMDKHSDDFPDDKQGGLEFCEKVTRETVKWLNKKYGAYVKISYKCFFRVRQNPPVQDYTSLHLGDSMIARAIADIKSGDYSWPTADVNDKPQENYSYWFGQYYFMDDDPEKQVGLLASSSELQQLPIGRIRDRSRKVGFIPGRLRGINHYLDKKVHEDYTNYDMMNLMNLHIDIMRLDSDITDGGGVKTRIEEMAAQLELPDEVRDDLLMIEEARILGAHSEEAKTLAGDYYMVLLLVDLCQRAVEVMDEVRAGTKTLEYAKYEVYAKLKEGTIRRLDDEITAYMNDFNRGKKKLRLNPPPFLKRGEYEAYIPPDFLQVSGIVTEALEQFAPYEQGKPFITGRSKVNMRVPAGGTLVAVQIGSLNTGNLQITIPAKGHPLPEDPDATALEAYQKVVDRLNEFGLNIPTEEQEVGSLTVSNPRKNYQPIIIAGPAGAGKSTTMRNLLKTLPKSKLVPTYTTRRKRKSDKGNERVFVSENEFKKMIASGEFLEYAKQKSGDYYGKRLADFKEDADYLIMEASLPGVNTLKKALPNAYTVYLEPAESPELIRQRIIRRGDMSPQQARSRASKIPSHIRSSKMMNFNKRIISRQGQFDSIALEIMNDIPKSNPGLPFRVPESARPEMERRLTEMMMQPGYKPLTIKEAIEEGIYDDQPSDFSYAQGEYEEFLEEIEKGDMDEAFAEYSDVEGHVAYWLYTNHGIEVPMYNTIHVEKTRKRVEVFADIFAQFGLEMDSKYLKGGSNFQKTTKVRLALETAAKDQGKSFNATDEEIRDAIAKAVPDVVMENPNPYYDAHLYASGSRDPFFPGDVPVAPPDLLRGNPSKKPVSVRIEESPNKEKKMVAYFYDKDGKKVKTTHFGARGMSDYTQHKDPERMKRYLARHGKMGEDWKDPTTAGALSRWILWGKPSLRESFNDYKKKFRLEGVMAVTNTRMNPKPKAIGIIVGGPPHSGKSVFIDKLKNKLRGKGTELFALAPDGEGSWSQKSNQEAAQFIRKKGGFTKEFMDTGIENAKRLMQTQRIVLIDIGGVRSPENERILKETGAQHMIVVAREDPQPERAGREDWEKFAEDNGVNVLASFDTSLEGEERHGMKVNVLRGRIVGLDRGSTQEHEPINALAKLIESMAPGLDDKVEEGYTVINPEEVMRAASGEKWTEEGIKDANDRVIRLIKRSDKPILFDGPAANWFISAAVVNGSQFNEINIRDFKVEGTIVKPEVKQLSNEELDPNFEYKTKSLPTHTVLTVTPINYLIEDVSKALKEMIPPELDKSKGVIISGKLPIVVSAQLALTYAKHHDSVAMLAPPLGEISGYRLPAIEIKLNNFGNFIGLPLKNSKRIPKKYEGQDPSEHSDLFTDEDPKGTIQGLGFKDKETAERSINIIKRSGKTHAHKMQAAMAMEQRARFHAHQTPGIRAGQKVYAKFIEEMKKKTKEMRKNPSRTPEGRKIPKKYLKGLNSEEMAIAAREIDKGYKYDLDDPKAYEEWKSDIKAKARGYKTVPSKYKKKFIKMYGPLPEKGEFLDKMAKATGIKKSILKKVYDKGLAAWATGHRVGVAPHQWATGRVYSFVTLGNTVKKGNKKMPDYSLAVEAGLVKKNPNEAPGNRVFNEPLLEALEVAEGYMRSIGKTYKTTVPIMRLNEPLLRRMAKAYDATPNGYDDPKTIKSYEAFIKETNAQFLAIRAAGYDVEVDDDDPYRSSQHMIDDLRDNKRLKIFSAESGFGSKPITDEQRKKNVLLRQTKHKDINGKTLLVEEMFRFTHDFFGHALKGNGFGPIGEENAWSSHSMMYSPLARPAMTTETRAQFAWTFYSGANRQTEKTRRLANTLRREGKLDEAEKLRKEIQGKFLYPDQKMILLPKEFTENTYPLDNPGEWRHGKMMDEDKDPFSSMFA